MKSASLPGVMLPLPFSSNVAKAALIVNQRKTSAATTGCWAPSGWRRCRRPAVSLDWQAALCQQVAQRLRGVNRVHLAAEPRALVAQRTVTVRAMDGQSGNTGLG